MSRVAVIGSGISGLATAWLLSRRDEVWVYERDARAGGHARTVHVAGPEGSDPVDAGFAVFNEPNYPLLSRLFRELSLRTVPSDRSLAVEDRPARLSWSTRNLNTLFSRRLNLLRPRYWSLLRERRRFQRRAPLLLEESGADAMTIAAWLKRERFSEAFRESYLLPAVASVWPSAPAAVADFSVGMPLRFFRNHGLLGLAPALAWRALAGGAEEYVDRLGLPFRDRILRGAAVQKVERAADHVRVHAEGTGARDYDEVVFACRGHEVLPLLASPTPAEQDVFGRLHGRAVEACVHADARVLPEVRGGWAAWNAVRIAPERWCMTAHANRIRPMAAKSDWFVSLDAGDLVAEGRAVARVGFCHVAFTPETVRAQGRWGEVSGRNRTHFCGAYWGSGTHEDGLRSAVRVAQRLGIDW